MKSFKENIFSIRHTIIGRIKQNNDTLYNQIQEKLNNNYENYLQQVELKVDYIMSRNNYKVLKNINKQVEKEEEDE